MAEEQKAEAPEASDAGGDGGHSDSGSASPDAGKLKLFLIINLVVVIAALGVSVFTFLKLSKPQISDIQTGSAGEEHAASGEHASAGEHGGGGGHGEKVEESAIEKKINLNRFVVNLSNSGGEATLTSSFQVVFDGASDIEFAKTFTAKMRDVSISLMSSKSVEEMSSIKGREELKEQMLVAFNSFFGEKAKASEILFTEFFLNTGV